MLKGDLASTPLPAVLRQLADGLATGCLHLMDPDLDPALIFFRGGDVYAVSMPGSRPQLGARLVSSGDLAPEALAEALEAQRTELQGWRLGELLVHLGYVDQPVIEGFVTEQIREAMTDLLRWRDVPWKFRLNQRTREDVAPPVPVEDLLNDLGEREAAWRAIDEVLHGEGAVPLLSTQAATSAQLEIDADAWSLLCKVDGERSVGELARDCGFTLFEAGQVVYSLVQAGLLDVAEEITGPEAFAPAEVEEPEAEAVAFDAGAMAARVASVLSVPAAREESREPVPSAAPVRTARALRPEPVDDVDQSVLRVSAALSALLGPPTASDDVFNAPSRVEVHAPAADRRAKRDELAAARRARDADELAAAQAELEAERATEQARQDELSRTGDVAPVVDLGSKRRGKDPEGEARLAEEARAAQEAEQARLAEAARVAGKQSPAGRRSPRSTGSRASPTRRGSPRSTGSRADPAGRGSPRSTGSRASPTRRRSPRSPGSRASPTRRRSPPGRGSARSRGSRADPTRRRSPRSPGGRAGPARRRSPRSPRGRAGPARRGSAHRRRGPARGAGSAR